MGSLSLQKQFKPHIKNHKQQRGSARGHCPSLPPSQMWGWLGHGSVTIIKSFLTDKWLSKVSGWGLSHQLPSGAFSWTGQGLNLGAFPCKAWIIAPPHFALYCLALELRGHFVTERKRDFQCNLKHSVNAKNAEHKSEALLDWISKEVMEKDWEHYTAEIMGWFHTSG